MSRTMLGCRLTTVVCAFNMALIASDVHGQYDPQGPVTVDPLSGDRRTQEIRASHATGGDDSGTWAKDAKLIAVVGPPLAEDSLGQACTTDGDCVNESVCSGGACYVPKNRYVSISPLNDGSSVAFQVSASSCQSLLGWVGPPLFDVSCETEFG